MTRGPSSFDAARVPLDGKRLVQASAGTGKTHAIATLFVRLVLERGLAPREIAVVTFTEAATAELRDRVRARLVEAETAFRREDAGVADGTLRRLAAERHAHRADDLRLLRLAIENADEAAISTIHGFCQRLLHDHAFGTRVSFGADLVPDLDDLYDDVLYDFWHRTIAAGPRGLCRDLKTAGLGVDRLREVLGQRRRNPTARVAPPPAPAEDEEVREAFERARREYRAIDLNGFLRDHCAISGMGFPTGGWTRAAEELDELFSGDDPWVPAFADKLHPDFVRAHWPERKRRKPNPYVPCGFFDAFARFVDVARRRLIRVEHDLLRDGFRALRRRKERLGVMAFEDLLQRVAGALEAPGGVRLAAALRDRYRAVLIDEFQDTDPVQCGIFLGVWSGSDLPLFLIGDPKQAIYRFRGADVFAFLEAARDSTQYTMDVCWRSDALLVRAVNGLFGSPGSFVQKGIEYHRVAARDGAADRSLVTSSPYPATKPLDLLLLKRDGEGEPIRKDAARRAVGRVVAADIARLLAGSARIVDARGETRAVGEEDVAVLTRTNRQCLLVQDALRAKGIRSVVQGDHSVFDTEEADDLQLVLGAALEPTSSFHLRRALATSILGVRGDEIARLDEDPAAARAWVERFGRWHDLWVRRGFFRMFRSLVLESGATGRLLGGRGGERGLTNVLHLGELLHRAASDQHLGPAALGRWLAAQRAGASGAASAEHAEIRLESDEAAVRILTTHKAKGLEFPIVYCPFLWDSFGGGGSGPVLLHDDEGLPVLDIDVDEPRRAQNVARARRESFAEELRVVYVAVTRAKHRCTVVWGGFKGMGSSAAAYLIHPPPALDEHEVPGADRLASATDAELLAALESIAEREPEAIGVRAVEGKDDAAPLERPAARAPRIGPARIERPIAEWARTDSFSGLIERREAPGAEADTVEAPEHDEGADDDGPPALAAARSGTPIALATLPKGRRTGDFFHAIFEEIDFTSADADAVGRLADSKLRSFGFGRGVSDADLDRYREEVVAQVGAALDAPLLPDPEVRLRDVPLERGLRELEFRFPATARIDARALAAVFRRHASDRPAGAVPAAYADAVGRLRFRTLRGFLKGYVDLVFEHDGRWYVVDYKTNHLGDVLEAYDRARMTRRMSRGHYFLQYHLYALAVHRYLARHQPGYEYERDFGGVLYLFVKGMSPEHPGRGIFFEKPPAARIEALSTAFGGAG